jgi:hypothetical protein
MNGLARASTRWTWRALCGGLSLLPLSACSSDPEGGADPAGAPEGGPPESYLEESAPLFDEGRRYDVELTLPEEDFRALGAEGRGLSAASCDVAGGALPAVDYTWFAADVTVDGEALPNVAVRKKGFLGSLSVTRPSLKVAFDEFEAGREHLGTERMTLNNNRQDPSLIRQCTAYWLFRRAGVPAPRCTFVHLTVNGEDLGSYSHVEGVTKRFLRAHFGSDTGNLYEGQGADFLSENWGGFELKTNEDANDRTDLTRLRDALLTDEAGRLEAIEAVVDLDAYLTYWAMEALVAHWDSYSTTRNNYLLYADPARGFRFIPWGTDATLSEEALTSGPRPQSISADSDLSRALFDLPAARSRYVARVRELLDEIWDEDAILDYIDRTAALLPDADATEIEGIREFVRRRRAVVTPELDAGPEPTPVSQICFAPGAQVSGSFSGVVGGGAPGTFELVVDGAPLVIEGQTVLGGPVQITGPAALGVEASGTVGGAPLSLRVQLEQRIYGEGTLPFHALSNVGFLSGLIVPGNPFPFQFVSDGSITLTSAGTEPGEAVAGTFTGRLYALQQ